MAISSILGIDSDSLPERVLVVGDPGRVEKVSEHLTGSKWLGRNREYHSLIGQYGGTTIAVVSHGVGSAGAGVCFEELCRAGTKRIVRVGSAGGLQPSVAAGSVVIARAAVREDGLSPKLVPSGYPAVATPALVIALREAAALVSSRVHEGIVLTSDLFYPGEALGSDLPLWRRAGVTAVEMEIATLFVVCGLHGVETAAVVAVDGNPLEQDGGSMDTYNPEQTDVKRAIRSSIVLGLTALTD